MTNRSWTFCWIAQKWLLEFADRTIQMLIQFEVSLNDNKLFYYCNIWIIQSQDGLIFSTYIYLPKSKNSQSLYQSVVIFLYWQFQIMLASFCFLAPKKVNSRTQKKFHFDVPKHTKQTIIFCHVCRQNFRSILWMNFTATVGLELFIL